MRELGDDVTHTQTHTRTQPFIVKDTHRLQILHLLPRLLLLNETQPNISRYHTHTGRDDSRAACRNMITNYTNI